MLPSLSNRLSLLARNTRNVVPRCPVQQSSPTANSLRFVHSKRQRKRLFDNNPARARVEARMRQNAEEVLPPPTRQFPPVFEPTILSNGWSAPPPDTLDIPEYPFSIARTENKPQGASGFLPVYSYHRKDGTKITTRIRKVDGDKDIFLQELKAVLAEHQIEPKIRIRTGGTIEVDGKHVRPIKMWLAGLGF